MTKAIALGIKNKYYEKDIAELNEKLSVFGISCSLVINEHGEYLSIDINEDTYRKAVTRNAGRKPHMLQTCDETELQARVDEVGIRQVADEEGVSVRTIQRMLKKWS